MYEVGRLRFLEFLPKPPYLKTDMQITIYYTEQTKNKLKDIMKIYHVSISTIANVVSETVSDMIPVYKQVDKDILNKYIFEGEKLRTTIKPKNFQKNSDLFTRCDNDLKTVSHILSNLLYLYSENNLSRIFNEANKNKLEKYNKLIINELRNKKEQFWNYNIILRNQTRVIMQNADYYKRKLGI